MKPFTDEPMTQEEYEKEAPQIHGLGVYIGKNRLQSAVAFVMMQRRINLLRVLLAVAIAGNALQLLLSFI